MSFSVWPPPQDYVQIHTVQSGVSQIVVHKSLLFLQKPLVVFNNCEYIFLSQVYQDSLRTRCILLSELGDDRKVSVYISFHFCMQLLLFVFFNILNVTLFMLLFFSLAPADQN